MRNHHAQETFCVRTILPVVPILPRPSGDPVAVPSTHKRLLDACTVLGSIHPKHVSHRELEAFMLVLSRKQNERIRVGKSVVVTVVRVNGDKVRIGIEAPSEMRVLRDELEEMGDVILEDTGELPISRLCTLAG